MTRTFAERNAEYMAGINRDIEADRIRRQSGSDAARERYQTACEIDQWLRSLTSGQVAPFPGRRTI